jgi:peroxiredoxin
MLTSVLALAMAVSGPAASSPPEDAAAAGTELVGKPAGAWEATEWLNSPPLTLAALRGKVVLVRWFTSPDCPYCSATAPALNQLHEDFKARGLVVIGMYHHKDAKTSLDVNKVKGWVADYKFTFPVAVDRDWRTLHRWWLDGATRDFTSVSFLIDKKGVIRRVHPGGAMALGGADYAQMRAAVARLTAE